MNISVSQTFTSKLPNRFFYMKFVIQSFALCTFFTLLLQPIKSFAQSPVLTQVVAHYETEPGNTDEELASSTMLGSISGEAFGAAKSTATIFQVTLYGPDDPKQYYATRSFGSAAEFHFDKLPSGMYWIQVSSGAGTIIKALPAQEQIFVEQGKNYISNVEFRAR